MNIDSHFSIIIPTFREARNIPELIKRIAQIDFAGCHFEVILVDDNSQDGIVEVVDQLQAVYPWIRLLVRKDNKSLSEAALEGFRKAHYSKLILMDADLSHPPEKIPQMLAALSDSQTDFVVGSRYTSGGSADEQWPVMRKITSRIAAMIAQILIARRVKDPLSGFFAVKKSTLELGDPLRPVGWKIGLEIMLKCHCQNIKEVPIHFSERLYGKSKLNLRVVLAYLRHVNRLMWYKMIGYLPF